MAQYKRDRFFKFYIQSLYKTKGDTQQNIQVRNDEDLEIDLMFIGEPGKEGWQQEDLGLFVGGSLDCCNDWAKPTLCLRGRLTPTRTN